MQIINHTKRNIVLAMMAVACGGFAAPVKTYPHLMNPRMHPDDTRREVKVPDASTFGNKMAFMALRDLSEKGYRNQIAEWIDKDRLGDIIWAHYGIIYNKNFAEQARELKKRGLFLFDLWGYVPGSGKGGPWQQFEIPPGVLEAYRRELGDHWLGMDNGEQDGRYIGMFAPTQEPYGANRFQQYLNFQRHFERLDEDLGNRMATLVSLNYGHYFLRENCYTLIGAETAQALPNAQVYYSFIRGAGKQYGVPWFGNVSVFNRWGWKAYPQKAEATTAESANRGTPTGGTSLALMKKLMFAQMFYNSVAVGFECNYYWEGKYTKDGKKELSPIGRIHRAAQEWIATNGAPGVMHVPVAVMADFYGGWCFPRHLYSGHVYKCWGVLPYDAGDFLTDDVLNMIYPGYADASYFHDERGFNTATPYGDICDCVLSDAPAWVLNQYAAVILTGKLTPSQEFVDTLRGYVRQGGELVLAAAHEKALFPEGFGDVGKGRVTRLGGGEWGITSAPVVKPPYRAKVDQSLPRPYPLTAEAHKVLQDVLMRNRAFATTADAQDDGLSTISCRRGKGEWVVCVLNNTWQQKPLKLHSNVGAIESIEELPIAATERTAIGFAPAGMTNLTLGVDSPTTIAAAATRTFRVKTRETSADIHEIAEVKPPKNVRAALLFLRGAESIKEQILKRPTFFRHYGGVMVDGRYFERRDIEEIMREKNWLNLQQVRVAVDLSGLFNLYPDLRLVRNDSNETFRTEHRLDGIFRKLAILGVKDVVIAPHVRPQTNITAEQEELQTAETIRGICARAEKLGGTVYLRQSPKRRTDSPESIRKWLTKVGAKNFRCAPSLAAMLFEVDTRLSNIFYMLKPGEEKFRVISDAGLYFLAVHHADETRQITSLHRPLCEQKIFAAADYARILSEIAHKKDALFVYDALYENTDEEYRDAKLFEKYLRENEK